MERVLLVTVRAPVVSFRRPLDHNYQRTLLMPPPTTLIGLAGAALGLSDHELWGKDSPLASLKVAVWMDSEPGKAQDMWTLLKIKGNKMERSPYFRELLFFADYTLVYGGPEDVLERLQAAFLDPAYPLSLGREDELIFVDSVSVEKAVTGGPRVKGTVVRGDVRKMGMRLTIAPGIRLEPPVVEELPVRFTVDSRGIRHPQPPLATLSFLPLGLEVEIPGLNTLQCRGRNFTWANS